MTDWTVRSKGPIVWIEAECPTCKSGCHFERPLMWDKATDDSGKTIEIDGQPVLNPRFNPYLRFRHNGCHGKVEDVPRDVLKQVLVAAGRPDLEATLLR